MIVDAEEMRADIISDLLQKVVAASIVMNIIEDQHLTSGLTSQQRKGAIELFAIPAIALDDVQGEVAEQIEKALTSWLEGFCTR